MADKAFPTTDTYMLEVNVDLNSPLLEEAFTRAMNGQPSSHEILKEMMDSLHGRQGIALDADAGRSAYSIMLQQVGLGPEDIGAFLAVSPDNLPPNIPEELTPELMTHLFALHESEHVTQFTYKTDEKEGYVIPDTIQRTFMREDPDTIPDLDSVDSIKEVDGDLAVVTHLDEMDLGHVSQFWLDGRICASFNHKFTESAYNHYEHDASSIVSYFRETGQVIDPAEFLEHKNELMTKIQPAIMGMDKQAIIGVLTEYPTLSRDQITQFTEIMNNGEYDLKPDVRPQTILFAVQELLDDGALDGLQKWEAENYVAAMGRLGYEPVQPHIPEMSYEDQIRDILENNMGIHKIGEEPEQGAEILNEGMESRDISSDNLACP